ncbi:hypothetical protein DC498_07210 [Terrimonas sp.]|uniref:hypothetical protein n=1 Tax=Terrimonas sp. TaxID=1914338 RepID=UPI000D525447|nr:hypothetical protein [Terrimonas sp.]PVD53141.1 hypothetical protein DC498_07210 [Terrimonas sp.]
MPVVNLTATLAADSKIKKASLSTGYLPSETSGLRDKKFAHDLAVYSVTCVQVVPVTTCDLDPVS